MTSLTTTEALVRRLRWTLAKVLPTKKLLIIRKYWKAQQKKLHSMADGYLYSYNCRSGRRIPTLLPADLGLNARLSAEQSLFFIPLRILRQLI